MRRNRWPLLAGAAALLLLDAAGRTAPRPSAEKWDIQITVECDGQYGLDEGDIRYDGQYGFTAQWVGLMERDDEDFLLIHKGVELERWQAAEKASRPGGIDFVETGDFAEKPELHVKYILKKEGFLEIALSVQGFEVPRLETTDTFRLALPSSAEDDASTDGIRYAAGVIQGSNRVFIEAASAAKGTEVKKFAWTWRWRTWIPKQDRNAPAFNTHKVLVTVAVTPHQEEGRIRPADGSGRRLSAAGRG